jgi:flagellar hook-associated protein 1 FlgK
MSSFLFGYYDLGLRALSAARLGLEIAGDNIANATTPGYVRRRMDLTSGSPVEVPGGFLDRGVEIARIRRLEDRFLQASLERERGSLGGSEERLRGLRDVEDIFGTVDGEDILSAYSRFGTAFSELAASPDDPTLRRVAVLSAEGLAERIRETYGRLEAQRRTENEAVAAGVEEIDRLAGELAALNDEIVAHEAGGETSPLRDRRAQIVEELAALTGGTAASAGNGRVQFSLPGGPTLVTGAGRVEIETRRDADGMHRIVVNDVDVTDSLRRGKIGALIGIRDDAIPARTAALDTLAADLVTRANAVTTAATDLDGNPGRPLFVPDPPTGARLGARIAVAADVTGDPRLLAISATGEPGDGAGAIDLAGLSSAGSAALGGSSASEFLATLRSTLGGEIVQADVDFGVADEIVSSLEARRSATTGVSLDEEAVELMRFQRSYEAAARFIQVLNEVTEIAVNLR